jgi:hypothetical protein
MTVRPRHQDEARNDERRRHAEAHRQRLSEDQRGGPDADERRHKSERRELRGWILPE